jgi:hypothetical protein
MKINKKIILIASFLIIVITFVVFMKSQQPVQNLSETKFASTAGSFQKVVNIKLPPQTESQLRDSKESSPKKKMMSRAINSQILDHVKKERDELQQMIDQSRDRVELNGNNYIFDSTLSFSPITGRESRSVIQGRYIYEKEVDDQAVGIAVEKGRVGMLTGEIIFKTRDINNLRLGLEPFNGKIIYSDPKSEFVIVKTSSVENLKMVITSNRLKKFNPKLDVVFDPKVPI